MKKTSWGLALLTLFACNQKDPSQVQFNGTIENPEGKTIVVNSSSQSDTLTLDENGNFQGTLSLSKATYATLKHGKENTKMFLIPGKDLQIKLNTQEFDESLTYEGENADINNYLAKLFLLNETITPDIRKLFSMEEAAFISKIDSIYEVKLRLFNELKNQNPKLDPNFTKYETARLLYDWAKNYSWYPGYYAYLSGNREYQPSEQFNSYRKKINLNNAEILEVEEYQNFISEHIGSLAEKIMKADESYEKNMTGYTKAKFVAIEKNITDKEVICYLAYAATKDYVGRNGANADKEIIAQFKKQCTNQQWITKVDKKLAKWAKLAKGKPAFDFDGEDIEGNKVALSDLKGKYVYVDVWATWCGPCRGELPYLEKLEKEFHGKNVTFVSISVDDNKEAWKKMVTKKQMKGIQLHAAKAWKSSICKDYMINGIPRFMLFDMEGKIINVNAPRPSGNIKEVLNKLENI
jgi:VCBS repeat-containing protein